MDWRRSSADRVRLTCGCPACPRSSGFSHSACNPWEPREHQISRKRVSGIPAFSASALASLTTVAVTGARLARLSESQSCQVPSSTSGGRATEGRALAFDLASVCASASVWANGGSPWLTLLTSVTSVTGFSLLRSALRRAIASRACSLRASASRIARYLAWFRSSQPPSESTIRRPSKSRLRLHSSGALNVSSARTQSSRDTRARAARPGTEAPT